MREKHKFPFYCANILAAEFLLVRAGQLDKERSPKVANMWVAEACNRPWDESDVNAYRFAKDKYWHGYGGTHWSGDDHTVRDARCAAPRRSEPGRLPAPRIQPRRRRQTIVRRARGCRCADLTASSRAYGQPATR